MFDVIFLDMDQVLVDFERAAAELHEVSLEVNQQRTSWDLPTAFGISVAEFWRAINSEGPDFWLGLEELPWANSLLELVRTHSKRLVIVSAPSLCPQSYLGKTMWLKRKFGNNFNEYILFHDKSILSREGTLLIDDNPANVSKFKLEGGEALLFPSYGNLLRNRVGDFKYFTERFKQLITELER